MRGLFIAGTDTGAGKTLVTGLLAAHCARRGLDVVTQKWVQTGTRPGQGDLRTHQHFGMDSSPADRKLREPYCFPLAASPHLAARAAGAVIRPARLAAAYRALAREHRLVLIEGTGGLMVPLTARVLQLDLVQKLRLPVLLVVANRLGCLNHTLLTLAALRARKMRVLGLVFTAPAPGNPRVLADNPRVIARFDRAPVLGVLPYSRSTCSLPKRFAPCGDAILRHLRVTR
jgi:dethiobiotin synthetase